MLSEKVKEILKQYWRSTLSEEQLANLQQMEDKDPESFWRSFEVEETRKWK